jgi:hypothetical protein
MRRGSAIRIGAMVVVVTLVLALFLQTVHLGFDVGDPQIGLFRSRRRSSNRPRGTGQPVGARRRCLSWGVSHARTST